MSATAVTAAMVVLQQLTRAPFNSSAGRSPTLHAAVMATFHDIMIHQQ
ncbi:hypothetical protein ACFWEB_24825 [Streptomyces parvus]